MNFGRGIAVGMLALATLGSSPARAQVVPLASVGNWSAYGQARSETESSICGIAQLIGDRYMGIDLIDGEKAFLVKLGNKQWRVEEGKSYPTSFAMDHGRTSWPIPQGAMGLHFRDGVPGVAFGIVNGQLDDFMREFRASNQIRFSFPTVDAAGWTVSLAGSSAVADALDRCRRAQQQKPSVLEQPLQWCFKPEGPTPSQAIKGCTAAIAVGLWTGKDVAVPLSRRVDASERLGDHDRVIADVTEVLRLRPNAPGLDMLYAKRGRAHFFQSDFSAAAADLSKSDELKDDPYTQMWRFLARRRAGPAGASELAASAAKLKSKDWPYPVIDFYLERRSAEELQAAATTPDQKCEAAFYLAEGYLLQAKTAEAKPLLQTAADTCPENFLEHIGAQAELKRLGP